MVRLVALGDALKKHASAYARFALSQVAAVTVLGLAAGSAYGLGLGKLTVQSALGETLRAEIDVSSLSPRGGQFAQTARGAARVLSGVRS